MLATKSKSPGVASLGGAIGLYLGGGVRSVESLLELALLCNSGVQSGFSSPGDGVRQGETMPKALRSPTPPAKHLS